MEHELVLWETTQRWRPDRNPRLQLESRAVCSCGTESDGGVHRLSAARQWLVDHRADVADGGG